MGKTIRGYDMQTKWLIGIMVLWAAAAPLAADTLIMADGRELEGKLISQSSEKIVFDVHKGSSVLQMVFKPGDVKTVKSGPLSTPKEAPTPLPTPAAPAKETGPTYFVIPIRDMIGVYVTAAQFEQALKDVERLKPTVVVLEVDSGGGSTQEAAKIIDLMSKAKDVRFVAYVKNAISAAAIVSLSCKEIYIEKQATIGGALAYRMTSTMPAEIGEKMQAIWRATCRSSAELGGHQPILAEGMVDQEIEIQIVQKDGRPTVAEGHGPTMLKRKGKLLVMTANEAVNCGLAKDIVQNYDDLGTKVGYASWTKPYKNAEAAYEKHASEFNSAKRRAEALVANIKDAETKAEITSRRDEALRNINAAIQAVKELQSIGRKYPEMNISEKGLDEALRRFQTIKDVVTRG
jgi:ATP-dependent protease ClpP protease subunit